VDEILGTAEQFGADAIYMSTAWNRAQILRSGHGVTEAVLDDAVCPVVAVPVG
jgi:nucleotide-binding universal stress UspA family protein